MTLLEFWVHSESAKELGWTLLHSLWQGAAIALALAIVLGVTRSSRVRYAAACLGMLALLTGFGLTLYRLMPREMRHTAAVQPLPLPAHSTNDRNPVANSQAWDVSAMLPWLAPIWITGVVVFQLRYLLSWMALGRLRRIGVCSAPEAWIETLDSLQARLRMTRPVTLLESCFAEVPVVIGHLRPVILMPVGLLAGLPVPQVEAILLHELAHIRRADYLVNLMQTLVEGLLFYHPAVWWISSVIRAERENCCDDLVVFTNRDAREYAMALAALAENRWTRDVALAATGGNLVNRIRRLLAQPERPRITMAPVLSAGIVVATAAVALAWQSPVPQQNIQARKVTTAPLLLAQAQNSPSAAPVASKYNKWLTEEVVYIITDQERADFKKLTTDAERDHFIAAFWERRDPTPGTPRNEYKEEHYRRLAYVSNRFTAAGLPGWKTDRGRIYIQYGPPDEIDSHPSGGAYTTEHGVQAVTYPFEQWKYRFIEGLGQNIITEFVDKGRTGEYRLTSDPKEKELQVLELNNEQAEKLAEQLRVMEKEVQSSDFERSLLNSQAQVEKAQSALEKMNERARSMDSMKFEELERASAEQAQALEKLDQKMKSDPALEALLTERVAEQQQALQSLAKSMRVLQDNRVFLSGSGAQAAVVMLPGRRMLITVPFEFPARSYSISVTAFSADGKTVWARSLNETTSDKSSTLEGAELAPGSYTLKALVKDAAGSTQKTYVVNFSVK